jgi:hypothetical protein
MKRTLLASLCLLLAGVAGASDTRLDPKAPQGAIGGRIEFPGNVVAPAMRICAISTATAQCIDSPAGRTLYRIEHLPPGEYQVVARVESPEMPVAGHVQKVECIQAPCQDVLVALALLPDKEIADANLNGFYAARPDFPALPELALVPEQDARQILAAGASVY